MACFALLALPSGALSTNSPEISTDKPDYAPGETVHISGTGFQAGDYALPVLRPDNSLVKGDGSFTPGWDIVTADAEGNFSYDYILNGIVGTYEARAYPADWSGDWGADPLASVTFTDANPSADLDQCANDPFPSPSTDGCSASASDWVNGNLGESKAVYFEGDSIPYRMRFDNLSLGAHTVTIEWDTTKGSKHAIDYLTTFNRTVATANPCLGVSGCGAPTTFAIPKDPQVDNGSGSPITQVAGNFTLYDGTITAVSAYSYPDGTGFSGDKTARITINFTASQANPVLAWGGHISARADWGADNSAVAIPGSPYHMRLIDLDGKGGNQDRSLSAAAVIFPGSITVIKDATPDGSTSFGFTASPSPLSNFSLVDDGTSANTKVFSNIVDFQTYTVSESSIPTGWGFDSASCSVTSPNGGSASAGQTTTINMKEGENWTCTYLDSLRVGTLIVKKHVVNDNGGTATASNWSIHVKSGGSDVTGSPQAGSESGTSYTLNGGPYNVSETGGPSGYTFTGFSGDCDSSGNVTVVAGQTKTCTLTNDDQTAHLKLVKTVTNDNGGTATATDWNLKADGTVDYSGNGGFDLAVNADTYMLSETGPSGYTASAWSCTGGTQNGDKITLANGQSATCTINNDDNAAHLKLIKHVTKDDGGTATETDFTLSASGPTPISGAGGADSDVNAGSYTLSETTLPGYTAGAWSCSGGTFTAPDKIALANGESATCEITNDDQPAKLKVIKHVTNDNGGTATAGDFTLDSGGANDSPDDFAGSEAGTTVTLDAGSYSVSETGPSGYSASYSSDCSGSIANGEEKTCTVTNDDQPAHLKLVKVVVNDNGGTASATAWTLSAAGPTPISGAGGAESDVKPGTYTLSESGPSGYSTTGYDCGASVTLALGESKTCTITNDDIKPSLTLVKNVTNDNGGTAVTTDFTLSASGPTPISGAGGTTSGATFSAGTYALSETSVAGYSASAWSCVGGSQNGDDITLGLGESATCTITNDDKPPSLTLVKHVVNDNGGTAGATEWTLSAAEGPTPISGPGGAFSGPGFSAGSYTLSESTGPFGYTAGSWSCTGGTFTAPDKIALALGESATCDITNNDIPPKLHLRKEVVNNNGGTAAATAWTLTADGANGNDVSGTTPVDSGPGLIADTWALSESGPAGYEASAWVCNGGTQSGANITVGIGGEATCTITNDDIPPKLHLRKVVVNDDGGTKTVADFTLKADGTGSNDLSGTSPVDSGAGLQADTWALSETNVYGYTASAWSCVGGTQKGSNITVSIGGEATCTITNDDQPGTIIIKKIIKPEGALTSFSFEANPTPPYNDFSLGASQQNSQQLPAGSYTVKELVPLGWVLTGIGGSTDPLTPYNCTVTGQNGSTGGSTGVGDLDTQTATIDLKNGDTVTCVFENTGQGVTRTQGFWATHTKLANIAWFGGTAFGHTFPGVASTAGIGDVKICGRDIDTLGKLMGGFWSDVSKKSDGSKRSSLDQARMQLLQQLLAAELNASAFGSVPSGGTGMFAQWEAALCGTNQNAIKTAQQQAASFNTAGDSSTFTPGTSADSKYARSVADRLFWDIIKP